MLCKEWSWQFSHEFRDDFCRIPMRIWVWAFHMTLSWANRVLHDLKRWRVFPFNVEGFWENKWGCWFWGIYFSFFWVMIVCHNLFAMTCPDWNGVQAAFATFCYLCLWVFTAGSLFLIFVKTFANLSSRKFTSQRSTGCLPIQATPCGGVSSGCSMWWWTERISCPGEGHACFPRNCEATLPGARCENKNCNLEWVWVIYTPENSPEN